MILRAFLLWCLSVLACCVPADIVAQQLLPQWPAGSRETKPWTRWWWHGSSLTPAGITFELESYKRAGLGGVEITPIYGVHGQEENFIDYLSPRWMDLLIHTLKEAERLDLAVDMATGTGWPFGGPWVEDRDACKNIEFKTYTLKSGERINERIRFVQDPYLRAVGSQIYEVHDTTIAKETPKGTLKEPLSSGRDPVDIKDLVQPVSANKNLQALALDQVKFSRELPLQTVMAYGENQAVVDLTSRVASDGMLDWIAPKGNWKIYALFMGWHGKMVERAGPGGEGNVIDHFSADALKIYLDHFDKAFKDHDLKSLRSFFNDSYEVDDARGNADWTPDLFEQFKSRRGYDLKNHLPALLGLDHSEKNARVLCDYRETISELVLENFTRPWKEWAHKHNALVRNQAHGSPSNILDLYATVDIPEIEGVEPLRIKMATSAGHVTGKRLISSESATWLNEHFESTLADIKEAVDRFMLQGVNHIFYHGTTYSPPEEPWPGRLFYAAVHLNPRNSLWPHFAALNKYVERTQSILQRTKIDNDILLYYPIYDRFSTPGNEMIEHFDAVGAQFDGTSFKRAAELMLSKGYTFDYVSDKQIVNTKIENDDLVTEGSSRYKTIVVPKCQYIPLPTISKLIKLAEQGATIIFFEGIPSSVNGYRNRELVEASFRKLIAPINHSRDVKLGAGRVIVGSDLSELFSSASIYRETLVDNSMQFLRKKSDSGARFYFIGNGEKYFEGWVTLQAEGAGAMVYNPMTGNYGIAKTGISSEGKLQVWVQLQPKESIIIEVHRERRGGREFPYVEKLGVPVSIQGSWHVVFAEGGPTLPESQTTNSAVLWTSFSDESYKSFSGSAIYSTKFSRPAQNAAAWILDLGDVKESAEVFLNGKSLGVLIGPVFRVSVADTLVMKENQLQIKVTNLMANRISFMDRNGMFWKKFYNVNFPARKAENRKNGIFDASHWLPKPSGLAGPVRLIPVAPN